MLSFDRASIDDWLVSHPGGLVSQETGLGERALPTVIIRLNQMGTALDTALDADLSLLNERLGSASTQTILRAIAHHLSPGSRLRILTWIVDAKLTGERQILSQTDGPRGAASRLRCGPAGGCATQSSDRVIGCHLRARADLPGSGCL